MKVYLAASWSRQVEMKQLSLELKAMGIGVTSRWLDEAEKTNASRDRHRRNMAVNDANDVRAADVLVRFTDERVRLDGDYEVLKDTLVRASLATGARMFETGLAWGAGIPIIVVGGHQNVFDYLPNIIHLKDVVELKKYLSSTEEV
jgi:hypothetical protein